MRSIGPFNTLSCGGLARCIELAVSGLKLFGMCVSISRATQRPRPDVVAYSLDGCCTLAAYRSAPETGVDLANPWRVRLTSQGGGDLLVAEDVARAHNHWKSLRPQEHDQCPHPHERSDLD